MIYLICALYPEAKPLIDKFKLKKTDDGKFQIFKDDAITLVITGTGQISAAIATAYVLTKYECHKADFVINIGICAGMLPVKRAYLINKITDVSSGRTYYPDMLYKSAFEESELFSGNSILSEGNYPLYDMEAAAIYQAAIKFISTDRISFIKIVSDNFSPESVKTVINDCLEGNISIIDEYILTCKHIADEIIATEASDDYIHLFDQLKQDFHCSVTMENSLKGLLKYACISKIDVPGIINTMKENEILPCQNKEEGKKALEHFRKQLF